MKDRFSHLLSNNPTKVYLTCALCGFLLALLIYYVRITNELSEIDKDFIAELKTESEYLDERYFLLNEQLKNIAQQAQIKLEEIARLDKLNSHPVVMAWNESSEESFIYDVNLAKDSKAQILAVVGLSLTGEEQAPNLIPIELIFSYELSQSLPSIYLTSKAISSIYYISYNAITAIYPNVDKTEFLTSLPSKYKESSNLPFITDGRETGITNNEPFLTAIYQDPLTESNVVTLGIPIWLNNQHLGNIGVDFTVSDLSRALNAFDKTLSASLLFNDLGQISEEPIALSEKELKEVVHSIEHAGSISGEGIQIYFSKTFNGRASLISSISSVDRLRLAISRHIIFMIAVFSSGIILLWFGWLSISISQKRMKQSLEHLDNLANIDELTKIANRRYFQDSVSHQYAVACHKDAPVALILIDIDHFKKINDVYGHLVGDEVLKQFSDVVSGCIRHSDLFARWGGEEFIILPSSVNNVSELSEKIRKAVLNHTFEVVGQVTVSIGTVYCANASEHSKKSIFEIADKALYFAKRMGRNQVVTEEV